MKSDTRRAAGDEPAGSLMACGSFGELGLGDATQADNEQDKKGLNEAHNSSDVHGADSCEMFGLWPTPKGQEAVSALWELPRHRL